MILWMGGRAAHTAGIVHRIIHIGDAVSWALGQFGVLIPHRLPEGGWMGAFLGLLVGVGALLIWQGLTPRPRGPRRHPRADRVREQLAQAGLSGVTPNQLVAVQVMVAVLVLLVGIVVTGSLSVSVVFGLFASVGPRLLVARLRRKRQADLRDLWPEVVDNLISGVRAGLSLPEALSSLGVRGPEPLREPFRRFGSDYRTTGKFGDCLDRLKTALADPVGDRVCESLRVAREVGGTDLGRLLATLSAFLREDAHNANRQGPGLDWECASRAHLYTSQ